MTNPVSAEPEAIPGVGNLIRSLVKGVRAIQLYLPNNPVYEQAMRQVTDAFHKVWEETSELLLEISDTEIRCEEDVVYSQPNKVESISWLLFKDGIRAVTFRPGVEDEEIVQFMTVLNRVRTLPPDAEDDLLTLLWEAEFTQLSYIFVELTEDEGAAIEAGESEPPSADAVREEIRQQLDEQPPEEFASLDDSEAALFELEPDEVAYLKREVAREYDQDLRASVLAILFDIFEAQPGPKIREEIISIWYRFLPHLLAAGDFGSVIYVLRESRLLGDRAKQITDEQRRAVDELPATLSEPETFGRLVQALEQAETESHEDDLEHLFGSLRPTVFCTALEWLPRMENERTRSLLEDALIKMAIAYPDALSDALGSTITEVVSMAVRFAKTLASPDVVPQLGMLLAHGDRQVRSEVVGALEAIGSPESLDELEEAIDDEARDVRLAVVRIFGARGHQPALPMIEERLTARELKDADLTEKKAFFEAFAALSGEAGIARLAPLLVVKGFMKRREDSEIRACAAMALGKIGTPEAAQVLQEADSDKDPLVRNAVKKALKEVEAS